MIPTIPAQLVYGNHIQFDQFNHMKVDFQQTQNQSTWRALSRWRPAKNARSQKNLQNTLMLFKMCCTQFLWKKKYFLLQRPWSEGKGSHYRHLLFQAKQAISKGWSSLWNSNNSKDKEFQCKCPADQPYWSRSSFHSSFLGGCHQAKDCRVKT